VEIPNSVANVNGPRGKRRLITEVVFEIRVIGFRTPPIQEYSKVRALALGVLLARRATGEIEVTRVAGEKRERLLYLRGRAQ
jgi:hypothetical protein